MFDKKDFLQKVAAYADKRRDEIRNTPDELEISGKKYYVSADGCDENDGLSPEKAWKTLKKVSEAELEAGDGVLFRRGDIFRGAVKTRPGVAYGAYGVGDKPKLYGWDKDLADPALWTLVDAEHNIWKMNEKILDPGTLAFNEGEEHCRKLIPSYLGGKFVCRNDESKDFVMADEMTNDLDLFWYFDDILTTKPSKGQDFPIPEMGADSYGDLYLRCDRGNPGECFRSVEALPRRSMFAVGSNANVRIDNLCLKYIGLHAIAAGGHVVGLHVTNCEIGWIGGTIQHYFGTDPNYPQGGRGTVTRFGNGVEIYGGCEDYLVENCYIYQAYDAGITHQVTTGGKKYVMNGIRYLNNLVEYCVYAIEYFLDMNNGDTVSLMSDIVMKGNVLRLSGYGWGQQRHNTDTPALIKGWSYVNNACDYKVCENVFDRCAYRMLHLVAQKQKSCPEMDGNTFIQHAGGMLGQYGGNEIAEPEIIRFDENIVDVITDTLGDKNAEIHVIE
ncbi:MAG: hypothetical protein IJC56_03480 [Clostridia bacterium]|nr:hypothetical protein [Clostridia bacterium]